MRCVCFLSFLFVSFISYYTNNSLSALVNNENFVFFDYGNEKIINSVNKNYIGQNGYLEKLRKYIEGYYNIKKIPMQILFTKNDIYVVKGNVDLSFSISYNQNTNTSSIVLRKETNYQKGNSYTFKLSDFTSIDDLISSLDNNDKSHYCNMGECTILTTTSKHNEDLSFKSYDYLDSDNFDYIVPYYGTNNSVLKTKGYNSSTTLYNMPSISGNIGFDTQLPYSYDLYSYDFKIPPKTWVFSVDLFVRKEDLENMISKISFKNSTFVNLDKIQVLGRIEENGVYHWEDLTYRTGKESYITPNYQEKYENETYSATFIYDGGKNIDKYEYFYFKFYLKGAKSAYSFNFEEHNLLGTYFNDIDQTGIFDYITALSMDNLHIFSTPLEKYNYHFFYNDYIDKTTNGLFPLHKFFKIPELSSDDIDKYEIGSYKSKYGNFIEVYADSITNKLGLYTYLVNGKKNGVYNTINELYYYTPVDEETKEPILYVSTGTLDGSRLFGDIHYVDSNGNIVSGTLRDDFEDYYDGDSILKKISNMVLKFFFPSSEELSTILSKLNDVLREKLGGFWRLIEIPITLFSNIISSDVGSSCLSIPDIKEPFTGMTLFDNTSFCFSSLRDSLPGLFNISDLLISIIATLGLANAFRKQFSNILGGGTGVN